ncbi:Crp/Fnr family transcriptional regulator [Tahibacter amnicola]|uniref:CRP-like protein Clp n=1 Tax=Tahibacter amnicola TaxID=2976241 RepID=A0ABY6BKJ3_9GAMM|nr:Crp/Fnr family transcriptional regulator [Tahibacter amnicola]UXI70538.1 Crp/Fnr family transcriptional regulator [Tahibacter amnicola]
MTVDGKRQNLDAAALRPLLDRGRWFATLPEPVRQRLLDAATTRRVPAGTRLFTRGDANDGLYCVLEGAVRVGATSADGREAVLSVVEPPQWFGEIAFFDGGPRTHNADTRVATTFLRIPRETLEKLLAEDPSLWRHMGALVAEKIRAVFTGVEEMALLPAPARIARRLLAMSEGYGMLRPGNAQRRISVNQEQLGAMLSVTRQTVSEVLGEFETRGLLKRHYGQIELVDPDALRRVGDGFP